MARESRLHPNRAPFSRKIETDALRTELLIDLLITVAHNNSIVNKDRTGQMEKLVERDRKRAERLRPEERQKQLLACAVREFARIGIEATVHADVAREADVSVPTVFIYFPTREVLINSVIAEVERFMLQLIEHAVDKKSASSEKIRSILLAFADAVNTSPNYVKLWMNWSTIIAEPTWSHYVAYQDDILARFETLIEEGKAAGGVHHDVDATMGAHLIMGSGHMIAQMKFRHRDDAMVETFIQTLIERALFTTGRAITI